MEPNLPELLTLSDGAKRVGLKAAQLRTEIRHGRLTHRVVAGKRYVTVSDLSEWLQRCRVDPKGPGCTYDTPEQTGQLGQSSTEQSNAARDAALMTARALKERSRNTSPASTSLRKNRLSLRISASPTS